jgi:hypothetical protein
MSRTFLFFYLFTTPFALLADVSKPFAHYMVVFFLVSEFSCSSFYMYCCERTYQLTHDLLSSLFYLLDLWIHGYGVRFH